MLGHVDYWLFLAGFGLIWMAWSCLKARRANLADAPWIWLVWSAAVAGAWHWQQFLVGCFGDSSVSRLLGQAALAAVPVLYFEFARRSVHMSGRLDALMKHGWSVVAGISVVTVTTPGVESTALMASTLGLVCCVLGLVAAMRFSSHPAADGNYLRRSVATSALLSLHITVAGPLHIASGYAESLSPGISVIAFMITALLSAASTWCLCACLVGRSELRRAWGLPAVIASVLLVGWIATVEVGNASDRAFRGDMKSRVLSAASGLDPALITSLAGEKSDMQTPEYRALKRVLIKLLTADPTNSFAYVMALKDGQVVFLADAEPDASPDVSLPGDIYESTTPGMLNSFNTGEPLVEGPYGDKWGTWISAFAPIRLPGVSRPLALLGLDADALLWKSALSRARLGVLLLVLLLCLATTAVSTAQRHSTDHALAESRRQYETLVRHSPNMIALLDAHGNVVSLNARGREYLGLEGTPIGGTAFEQVWPEDLRPRVSQAVEAAAQGKAGRYEVSVPGPDGLRYLSLAVRPVLNPSGGTEGIICTGSDVSSLFHARSEIQAQAAFLQGLLDTMPHFITAKDLEGRFTCCNLAAARFLRLDPEDILGKTAHEVLPPEVADELGDFESQLLTTGGRVVHEVRVAGPDGQLRDILYTKGLYYDPDGAPAGFVGVGFDVTERKQTERCLRESEERMRAIAAAAMDAVIMMDERGNISFWNGAAATMFGYPADEALGKPVHELLAPPRFHAAASEGLEQFYRTGTGAAVGKVFEIQALRRSGEEFTVELSVAPVRIGQNWHAVGILRDITERQAAEEQRRLLAEVVQQSEAGVLIVDPMGRPMYANAAFERMRGLPAGECWSGTAALSILPDASLTEAIEHIMSGGDFWRAVVSAERADGGRYRAEVHAFPVRQPSGELGAIVCTQRDVSKEEALEVQLRQAQKLTAIGQLAAGIAHEINTPIQYVADNARFLQSSFSRMLGLLHSFEDLAKVTEQRVLTGDEIAALRAEIERVNVPFLAREIPQAAQEALEGLDQVAKIVRAMKEFSHPGGSEMQPTDINAAVSATLTVSRNVWKYVAELESDLAEDLPTVDCQPGDINQIVLNLVVNAAQAVEERVGAGTGEKGTITVRTSATTECVIVTVTDNGCGIPEEIRDRIFEPFFTTKEVGKGTGQGLWIAHSLTEKHGGTLTFVSDPGKGTTFTLALPITRHEAGSQEVA
jgi:PAS domain S-box-containing protein